MTIATLKIGSRKFVVLPERDFDRIRSGDEQYRRLKAEDQALGKLASRRLAAFKQSGQKGVPLEQVKRELGLE